MSRTGWMAALAGAFLTAGLITLVRWPSSEPAFTCDASDVRWEDAGSGWVAVCAPGAPLGPTPAGAARALGVKFDLNRASEQELAEVPGIGPALARTLVEARAARSGFQSWEEVRAVRGVGPARLERLQEVSEIRR